MKLEDIKPANMSPYVEWVIPSPWPEHLFEEPIFVVEHQTKKEEVDE
jgi:hypothetical protein